MLKSPPHDRDHAFAATLAEERREGDRGFPLKRDVAVFVDELLGILFGQLSEGATGTADELQARLTLAIRDLRRLVTPLTEPGETVRVEVLGSDGAVSIDFVAPPSGDATIAAALRAQAEDFARAGGEGATVADALAALEAAERGRAAVSL